MKGGQKFIDKIDIFKGKVRLESAVKTGTSVGALVSLILHGLLVTFVTMKLIEMRVTDAGKPTKYGIFELTADMGGLYYFLVTSWTWVLSLPMTRNTTAMLQEKMYTSDKHLDAAPRCFDWKYLVSCCIKERKVQNYLQ